MFKKYHNCLFFSTLIPLFSTAIHHVASLCSVQDEISSRQLCVSGRNAMWEPSGSSFIYSRYARCAHQVDSTWKNNRRQCSVTCCRTHEAADVLCVFLSSLGWSQSKPLKCCNVKMSKHEWNFCGHMVFMCNSHTVTLWCTWLKSFYSTFFDCVTAWHIF